MMVSFVCSTVILQAEKFYFFHLVQQLGRLSIKRTEQRIPVFRTNTGFSGDHIYLMICADTVNAKYSV